jgi:hypothetical protein
MCHKGGLRASLLLLVDFFVHDRSLRGSLRVQEIATSSFPRFPISADDDEQTLSKTCLPSHTPTTVALFYLAKSYACKYVQVKKNEKKAITKSFPSWSQFL